MKFLNEQLDFLKKGSGIHIKKENQGKFTDYCGGKVTSACIAKGKSSSNPTIRKRATFAANARKWKHESGGILRFLLEGGKNAAPSNKFLSKGWFKSAGLKIGGIANNIGDFLNTDLGKGVANIGQGLFSGYMNYKNNSSNIESQVASNKALLELQYENAILEALKTKSEKQAQFRELWKLALANGTTNDNYSDIVASHFGQEEYNAAIRNAEDRKLLLLAALDAQAENAKGSMLGNLFGSVVLNGLGVLGNVLGNKNSTTSPSTTSPSTTQNLLNSSTTGKSSNPYMYTGLGANYNASTFFK